MHFPTRHRLALAAACTLLAAPAVQAQGNFPSQPVRIIVGSEAGSAPDVLARVLGKELSAGLGQAIIVENRAGASGAIGSEAVARAPADGYTLLVQSPTLPIFATCMLIQGLAQSTGWSGLCKNIGSFYPAQQRGRVLGLWSSCYAFGGLVASPFAGWWAYTYIGSWHAAFISSAVVVAFVALLFFIFQRNKPEDVGLPAVEPEPQLSAEEVKAQGKISVLAPLRDILRNRTVLTLGLAYFMLKPARYAILLWGPVIVFEQMPSVGKVGAAIIPTAFELAGLLGPILLGLASDKLFGARRMPACVLSLLALTVTLALFMGALHSGSVLLVVALLFVMGLTLYGPDSMISGAAAIDFGTARAGATAAGFVNGCGSVGAILGGLLPGYFDTVTVFIVFAGCALFSALVLLPHWNSRPASAAQSNDVAPNTSMAIKPLRT